MNESQPRLLTVTEVAKQLNLSVSMVYKLIENRELGHVSVATRGTMRGAVRVTPDQLASFVESRIVPPVGAK